MPPEVRDPVCGDTFPAEMSSFVVVHGNETHYFCCAHCKAQFEKEPTKYAQG